MLSQWLLFSLTWISDQLLSHVDTAFSQWKNPTNCQTIKLYLLSFVKIDKHILLMYYSRFKKHYKLKVNLTRKQSWIMSFGELSPTFTMAQKPVQLSSTRSAVGTRVFLSQGWQQLFMGVSSCSGPIMNEELQAVMQGGELEWWGSLLAPVPLQHRWVVPLLRHSVCEKYKHSASVQPLLITPKTGQLWTVEVYLGR